MASVSRRQAFVQTAAAAASVGSRPVLLPKPRALDRPAGCQTYPGRVLIAQGFPGPCDLLFQLLDPKLIKFQSPCSTITKGSIRWRTLQSTGAGLSPCSTARNSERAGNRRLGDSG
jgi:hypothetical protein